MRILHKYSHHHPRLSFPTVKSEFTLWKPRVYPTLTPPQPRPIWKCINMQIHHPAPHDAGAFGSPLQKIRAIREIRA